MSATHRPITTKPRNKTNVSKLEFLVWLRLKLNHYLSRHIQAALLSLGQICAAPLTNGMIILVIAVALALPTGLFLILKNAEAISGQWNDKAPILLYLKKNIPDNQAQALAKQLSRQEKIEKVSYVSPIQGLKEFQEQSGLSQVLNLVKENPLPGLLVLTPRDNNDFNELKSIAESLKTLPEVETVKYDEDWVKRLSALIDLSKHLIYGLAILLAMGVLFIVGATIHLATESHREEIIVYQLVGASPAFIRRPFLYTGIWYGLLGAAIALLSVALFLVWINESFQQLTNLYQGHYSLQKLGISGVFGLLLIGVGLGWLGSWFAVWRQSDWIKQRAQSN